MELEAGTGMVCENTAAFLRFTALYGYARIVRSLSEVHPDEPEWMADLRKKLHQLMRERRAVFGNPLVQKP